MYLMIPRMQSHWLPDKHSFPLPWGYIPGGVFICETKIKIFKITVDNSLSPCYYVIKVLKQQQTLLIQKHFSQFFYTIL